MKLSSPIILFSVVLVAATARIWSVGGAIVVVPGQICPGARGRLDDCLFITITNEGGFDVVRCQGCLDKVAGDLFLGVDFGTETCDSLSIAACDDLNDPDLCPCPISECGEHFERYLGCVRQDITAGRLNCEGPLDCGFDTPECSGIFSCLFFSFGFVVGGVVNVIAHVISSFLGIFGL